MRVFLQTAGVQAAFKDAPAQSVCRHPSLICYENQDYFSLWFRLPQIWSSHSMRERTNLSKQLLVKIVYVTLLVNVKMYTIFSTCKTCWVTLDQVWWHFFDTLFFFANKTVRGWRMFLNTHFWNILMWNTQRQSLRAEIILSCWKWLEEVLYFAAGYLHQNTERIGEVALKNAFRHIDGLFILAAAQKTNGGGCRVSRSGLQVLNK